ncbi:acyl-CoA/acyl-ACP dehydrogenase [bacterium]|nr:acyl-CoA/acyl-ACP dehydrogenase [bacterium]
MDLEFSKEQKLIKDEAVKFLKKECPYSKVKELEETVEGYSSKMWKKMADLGWLGLYFPKKYGGDGGCFFDLILLEEALGASVCPSPFFSTVIQCGLIIMESGSDEQKKTLLPKIADGKLILGLAQYEEDGSYDVADTQTTARVSGEDYILNGTKLFVMDANIADKLLITARTEGNKVTVFLVDAKAQGITITKMPTIGKDNNCEVILKQVKIPKENIVGSPGDAERIIEKMNDKATVAKAAEMLGGSKACIDMTADYAKQRIQYGKPIGGFQVIQHYMANMMIAYDTSHEYLNRIVCKIDEGENFAVDAYALKANVNEAYKYISERGVQIHGGIGTTREGDVGLFYRKAKANEYICGDTEFSYNRVFEKLLSETAASEMEDHYER